MKRKSLERRGRRATEAIRAIGGDERPAGRVENARQGRRRCNRVWTDGERARAVETDQAEPAKPVGDSARACGYGLVRGRDGMKMRSAGSLRQQQDRGANSSDCANPPLEFALQLDRH